LLWGYGVHVYLLLRLPYTLRHRPQRAILTYTKGAVLGAQHIELGFNKGEVLDLSRLLF